MSSVLFRLATLTVLTGLLGTPGRAQSRPPAAPAAPKTERQLVVTLTLPSSMGVVRDYAAILFSDADRKDKKAALKRAPRTSNPVVQLTLPLPGSWGRRTTQPAPASPPR